MPSSARYPTAARRSRTSVTEANTGGPGSGNPRIPVASVGHRRSLGGLTAAPARHPWTTYLHTGELAQPHRPPGVELLGGDPDLGPEPELAAVDEPGRRVHHDGGGVDLAAEPLGGVQVAW